MNIEKNLMHDGLTIESDLITIHQRAGKGDINIPASTLAAVSVLKGGFLARFDHL